MSEKTKERLKDIIHHLKEQQNILQQQNALAEKQAFLQKELEKKIDKQAFNDEAQIYDIEPDLWEGKGYDHRWYVDEDNCLCIDIFSRWEIE